MMKERITRLIGDYIRDYEERNAVSTRWGIPLVGFADACSPDIISLKTMVASTHRLPSEFLPSAKTVIAYFVPFTGDLAATNKNSGETASPEWALAYEETNAMFRTMNEHLIDELKRIGHEAAVPADALTFDRVKLISNWSQRHIARAAGLGTFGINNMLITKTGCCGRFGSVVTNLKIEPDVLPELERCVFKNNGRCGACISRCPSGALTKDGFNREKCYQLLRKNAALYTGFGSSYINGTEDDEPGSSGSEVCGKCVTNVPCSFIGK